MLPGRPEPNAGAIGGLSRSDHRRPWPNPSEIGHEVIESILMLGFTETGQMSVDGGGDGTSVSEIDLYLAQVFTSFEQMSGVGVPQGVDVGDLFDAAFFESLAEGQLECGAGHRFGGGTSAPTAVALCGKEQGGMTMRLPLLAQQEQGAFGQGNIPILIALAGADVKEHALGIDVADLEPETFTQAQAAGVNGGQTNAVIQSGHRGEDTTDLRNRKDDRKFVLRIGANQFQFVGPDAFEGLFPKDLDGADGLSAGLAGDLFVGLEVDTILADVLGLEAIGRFGEELAELTDTGVIGLLGAGADGKEFEVVGEGF